MLTAVREGYSERTGASFTGLALKGGLAGAEAGYEGFNLLLRLELIAQRLAGDNGERHGVSLGEGEEGAPVLDISEPAAELGGQGSDELEAPRHPHARNHDACGHVL